MLRLRQWLMVHPGDLFLLTHSFGADNACMAMTLAIMLVLTVIFFVLRFVRSRFGTVSDLPDSDLPDSDLPHDGPDDPNLGSPARLRGGPKRKTGAAEVEEPDDA